MAAQHVELLPVERRLERVRQIARVGVLRDEPQQDALACTAHENRSGEPQPHLFVGDVPRILAVIAAAAVETGVPVMVHTNASAQTGLPALEALTNAGVDPRRIVIAHAGDSNDLDYLHAIAGTGASLGCDRFSIEHFNSDANRVETLAALIAEGYTDRVQLGHDGACFYDFMVGNPLFADERPDYLHISKNIVPALLGAGVTPAQVDEMLVDNPRRFFAPAG